MRLGSHLSIGGGLDVACRKAASYGFDCLGLFVRNQVQWAAAPLSDEKVAAFRKARRQAGLRFVVAHASYLVNLAGNETIRPRSIDAMVEDLTRCGRLGIEYLVVHPGSHDDETTGIGLIADAIDRILERTPHRRPKLLLETTAGQGRCIGWRFEHLAAIRRAVRRRRRVGVCLDTCHVFAAGYDIRDRRSYGRTMRAFDRTVGLENLLAIHCNDTKREFACRVDRHEHIGRGQIGLEAFRCLVRDRRLAEVPMILETPKDTDELGRDWDEVNAATLRELAKTK